MSPTTGHLYVAFENFNTQDENQWLVVRSTDGGATFAGPFFVTPAFDVNSRASAADCTARGAQSRSPDEQLLPHSDARGAIVADKRGGAFADDLYLVMSDNRNGTRDSTNSDVFLFKSLDGGSNWIGPTRVNDDPSTAPANRDCGRAGQPACPAGVHTGNDQFWPWVDINETGRPEHRVQGPPARHRLDRARMADEPPAAGELPGLDVGRAVRGQAGQRRPSASLRRRR